MALQKCLTNNVSSKDSRGFTIVELLVVIVVIGILAAITIVSYTGITSRANAVSLQSDLTNASQQLKLYQIDHSSYPTSLSASNCPLDSLGVVDNIYCLKSTSGNTFLYSSNNSASPQTFSLYAINTGTKTKYRITNDLVPTLATPIVATGGTVTNIGGYRIHTFTTSGTFTITSGGNVEVLVVAGGGGGSTTTWGGGGGGGGGVLYDSTLQVNPSQSPITVTVGASVGAGVHGNDSFFGALQAFGGGNPKSDGGSGSGCPHSLSQSCGVSIQTSNNGGIGYGNSGGDMVYVSPYWPGSGGGAGAPGTSSGPGGAGKAFDISGTTTYYAGGGGSRNNNSETTAGGIGGGGASGISGTDNTGGGGGGSGQGNAAGGGGSGIVIVRYPN